MEVDQYKDIIENIGGDKNSHEQCRICMKSHTSPWNLFRDGENVVRKLMTFANVQVQEGDGLPTIVCLDCRQLVDIAYDFKCLAEQSDVKLRQALLSENPMPLLTHSIDNVEAGTISENSTQKEVSCDPEDRSQPLSGYNSEKTGYSSVPPIERYTPSLSSNGEDMIGCDITCDQKNQSTSKTVDESNICRENVDLTILDPLKEENSSEVTRNILEPEVQLNASFEEEFVKLEETQNQSENANDNVEKSLSPTKNVENDANDCDDTDEDDVPLIRRTQRQECSQCIKTFPSKKALDRHMAMHKKKAKLRYVCYMCDKQFLNVDKLKSHLQNNHIKGNNKSTNHNRTRDPESGRRSRKSNKESKENKEKKSIKFCCKVCSKKFTYQKAFITHAKFHTECDLEEIISDYLPPKVLECSSKTKEIESEDEEIRTEGLQCLKCGKLFATKRNLKRHVLTHTGQKYNCPMCDKEFSRIDKMKEHEQIKHKIELFGELSDDDFDEGTDDENKGTDPPENQKKERKRPHQCDLCPKAFAQPQSLANHMERHKRVKETQKRFLCEVCSKCFAQSGSLVAHMRTHTGVKPYVCNVCTKAFTKSTYLQLHLRTHSGEKPYICQYCSRAFARANTLARHITMHTGEAKYHCQICMKSFRRLTSLNEHTYTHTGQRPYACKICAKRYNNAGSLYAHTKKCKAQQQSGNMQTYTVSTESSDINIENNPTQEMVIYTQKKLVENTTVGQLNAAPQFMVANVHNQKPLCTNVIQPFSLEDPNIYSMNAKQFKNPYYALYPNM